MNRCYFSAGLSITEKTVLKPCVREFWEKLCGWVVPASEGGSLNIFAPLAASGKACRFYPRTVDYITCSLYFLCLFRSCCVLIVQLQGWICWRSCLLWLVWMPKLQQGSVRAPTSTVSFTVYWEKVKGIVHPEMTLTFSSFTQPQVVSNVFEFFC